MTDPPAGPDYPQRSPQPGDNHGAPFHADRHRLAAVVIRALRDRAPVELDTADLTVAGGDTVQILCLADVTDWLSGWAVKAEAGEPL